MKDMDSVAQQEGEGELKRILRVKEFIRRAVRKFNRTSDKGMSYDIIWREKKQAANMSIQEQAFILAATQILEESKS